MKIQPTSCLWRSAARAANAAGALLFLLATPGIGAPPPEARFNLDAFAASTQWLNRAKSFAIEADGTIAMSCGPHEALFNAPIGSSRSANCPVLLFRPAKEFVPSAAVSGPIANGWDAVQLIVWQDADHWAKLCLERTLEGQPAIDSVVTRGTSDDCVSASLTAPATFLQIARVENCIFFYYSEDRRTWHFVRGFAIDPAKDLRLGFSCESTNGDQGTSGRFADIRYRPEKVTDFFRGE